ncbi:hypothetical protein EBME_0875 [bacterium endosymbiont of Mortierella elongata FMR23-6]|nr:hypothetical protein EBME_0875 [bacterium endosymbiont of Mortierella elongata FMR23-6]
MVFKGILNEDALILQLAAGYSGAPLTRTSAIQTCYSR